jgi:hypothetical protein
VITGLAKWWLERHGHYVVSPGSCQMILSGRYFAHRDDDGSFRVVPPHPRALVVALNHTMITDLGEKK